MRPAPALTAALVALLAVPGLAAADALDVPDATDLLTPARESGDEVQDTFFTLVYGAAAEAQVAADFFQQRFEEFRGIAEGVAAEGGASVNRCAIGSALPPVGLPRDLDAATPDPAALVASANAWGNNWAVPLNSEAACRAAQAAHTAGAPVLDPPDLPALPAVPDAPAPPQEVTVPSVPELQIPDVPLPA